MPYTKQIVCLANSRKMSGRCVAGKEIFEGARFRGWIRPVSNRPTQEVNLEERRYENGEDPKLLDVITIRMQEHVPHAYQTENHLIDGEYYWTKTGVATWESLDAAVEPFQGTLWIDGDHSYNGENDRIREDQSLELRNSLTLVETQNLVITVAHEGVVPKRKVRARFSLGNKRYVFAITDPVVEGEYLARENGVYPVGLARLCISIGEPFQGFCYKLVAGIMKP